MEKDQMNHPGVDPDLSAEGSVQRDVWPCPTLSRELSRGTASQGQAVPIALATGNTSIASDSTQVATIGNQSQELEGSTGQDLQQRTVGLAEMTPFLLYSAPQSGPSVQTGIHGTSQDQTGHFTGPAQVVGGQAPGSPANQTEDQTQMQMKYSGQILLETLHQGGQTSLRPSLFLQEENTPSQMHVPKTSHSNSQGQLNSASPPSSESVNHLHSAHQQLQELDQKGVSQTSSNPPPQSQLSQTYPLPRMGETTHLIQGNPPQNGSQPKLGSLPQWTEGQKQPPCWTNAGKLSNEPLKSGVSQLPANLAAQVAQELLHPQANQNQNYANQIQFNPCQNLINPNQRKRQFHQDLASQLEHQQYLFHNMNHQNPRKSEQMLKQARLQVSGQPRQSLFQPGPEQPVAPPNSPVPRPYQQQPSRSCNTKEGPSRY